MFTKVRTVHLDGYGSEVVMFHDADAREGIEDIAARMFEDYPGAVIEVRYVR